MAIGLISRLSNIVIWGYFGIRTLQEGIFGTLNFFILSQIVFAGHGQRYLTMIVFQFQCFYSIISSVYCFLIKI